MEKFEVENVNCERCANTIKSSLEDDFGYIDVDMSVKPRVLSCDLLDKDVEKFKNELNNLGFTVIKEL